MKAEAITIKEMALMYFPNSTPDSARRQLSRWIQKNTQLQAELVDAGFYRGQRVLTPRQAGIIIYWLGEPWGKRQGIRYEGTREITIKAEGLGVIARGVSPGLRCTSSLFLALKERGWASRYRSFRACIWVVAGDPGLTPWAIRRLSALYGLISETLSTRLLVN